MNRKEFSINTVNAMNNPSKDTVQSFWYDWFCSNKALDRKGRNLLTRLRSISKHTKKFDLDNSYVFFKNNCPCWGDRKLYDDFRVCDMKSGDVLYTIIPRSPDGNAVVWGKENHFESELVKGTWKDVKAFFNN